MSESEATNTSPAAPVTLRNSISSRLKLKIVILGDSMTGKTSLLLSFKTKSFLENDCATVLEVHTKELMLDDMMLLLDIIEVPCIDGYDKVRTMAYGQTQCFIICYAVNNPSSFANVKAKWLPEVKAQCPGATVLLLGTKLDLKNQATAAQTISEEQISKLVKSKDVDGFRECSAKSHESVERVFTDAARIVFKRNYPKRGSCKQT